MIRYLILLLFVASCGHASADEILVVTKSGYYVLDQDAAGAPKLTPIAARFKQVVVLDEPEPGPSPNPTPALTTRAIAIRDAASGVQGDAARDQHALELAALYAEVARRIRIGELTGATDISFVIRSAADMLLATAPLKTSWQPVRDILSGQFVALQQEGGTDAAFAQLMEEAAAGLKASVQTGAAAIDLAKILEIIKLILELLNRQAAIQPAPPLSRPLYAMGGGR